ncbi:hypothetical protein FHT28_002602 [Rhizobium sp. SG570]|nr:hypothetical protein [Rhizobium sp. SG570]
MTDSQYNYYMGYAGNGFTVIISLEDSNSSGDTSSYGGAWQTGKGNHYAPDVVLGAGYTTGAWSLRGIGGYDSVVEEGAVKARIDADFGAVKAFLMGGWNTDGDKLNKYAGSYLNSNRSACPTNGADCGWGDWAFWTGASYQLTPKLQANAQGGLHRLEDLRRYRKRRLASGQGSADRAGSLLHRLGCRRPRPVGRRTPL